VVIIGGDAGACPIVAGSCVAGTVITCTMTTGAGTDILVSVGGQTPLAGAWAIAYTPTTFYAAAVNATGIGCGGALCASAAQAPFTQGPSGAYLKVPAGSTSSLSPAVFAWAFWLQLGGTNPGTKTQVVAVRSTDPLAANAASVEPNNASRGGSQPGNRHRCSIHSNTMVNGA
jgi:hypothetical protein